MKGPRVGPWYDAFSARLQSALDATELSGREIARRLRVDEANVSRWRRGQVPEPDILPRLVALCGISLDQLYGVKAMPKRKAKDLTRKTGRPRNLRRMPDGGELWPYDEDRPGSMDGMPT